ncbi:MAG: putative transrane protein of unknown function [Bacteroidetes bacterium]|nr:putative transrane protein of unknown function [Bacteroidota bacterium]
MKDYIKKNYNWLWILSIILFSLGTSLNIIFDIETSVEDNAILGEIASSNGWIMLILTIIIAPLIEEFSFRSWAINKKWTKYLCLILSTVIVASINIYVSVFYFFILLLIILLLEDKPKHQTLAYIFITTIGFVLSHWSNLDLLNYLVALPSYIAVALFISFIAVRFKFRYAILTHGIYNFTLLLLGGFIIPYGTTITLNEGNYKGTLTPVSGLFSHKGADYYGGYSASINRTLLPKIVASLNFDSDFEIKTYPSTYSFYNLKVENNDKINKIDLKAISKELIKKCKLRIDTITEIKEVYFLTVKDINKIKLNEADSSNPKKIYYPSVLKYVVSSYANAHKIIIRVPEEYKEIMIKDNTQFYIDNQPTKTKLPQFLKNLEKEYGFILTPKQAEVKTIRIFED